MSDPRQTPENPEFQNASPSEPRGEGDERHEEPWAQPSQNVPAETETLPAHASFASPDVAEPAMPAAVPSYSGYAPAAPEPAPGRADAPLPDAAYAAPAFAGAPMPDSAYSAPAPTPGYTPYGVPLPETNAYGVPMPSASPAPRRRRRPGWLALTAAMATTALISTGVTYTMVNMRPTASTTQVVQQAAASAGNAVNWQSVAAAVSPAVVTINVSGQSGSGVGSGAVVDARGHIVTNYHVISSALGGGGNVQVTLSDGRIYDAQIVGHDQSTDLAVIRMIKPPADLTVASFGSSGSLKVGQPVMAVGSPLGLSNTVTTGIISALNRPVQVSASESGGGDSSDPFGQLPQRGRKQSAEAITTNAIQIDASINPGNSGGPLFDEQGTVIGINSSIASMPSSAGGQGGSIGLGFAIPSDLVMTVVNQLIEKGTVDHAKLGVNITTGIAQVDGSSRAGAEVGEVVAGSGAQQAGLRKGDVITAVDGNTVTSAKSLVGYIRRYTGGSNVTVTYVRDGVSHDVQVTLQSDSK